MESYHELLPDLFREYDGLKREAHRFAQDVLRPASLAMDAAHDAQEEFGPDSRLLHAIEVAYERGYHKISIPQVYGGWGLNAPAVALLLEELGWGSAGIAMSLVVASIPFQMLGREQDPELIERFVTPFAADKRGAWIGCIALSEERHGSDSFAIGSREFRYPRSAAEVVARREGDDYVIDGSKALWISNGGIATHALVSVALSPSKASRAFAFVPLDLPGINRGKVLNKCGQRDLDQAAITFRQVRIPRHFVLCADGYEIGVSRVLAYTSSCMASVFTGLARAAYEEAVNHSIERTQGGKALSEHQLVQKRLFDMFTKVEACRALSRNVLCYDLQADLPSLEHAIAAKIFCTQGAFEVTNEALQLFGSHGIGQGCLVDKLFRDARLSLIEQGVNEVLGLVGASHILQN